MKTAVIISGQMRTFARGLPNLKFFVFDHLKDPAFFVSAAKDEDAASAELLRNAFPNAQVEIEVVEQPTLPEPPISACDFAPYSITPTRTPGVGPLQGILRQQWHLSRGWKFAIEKGAGAAEVFVRCRADIHFYHRPTGLALPVDLEIFGAERTDKMLRQALTPWWGTYGGVNDRFGIFGLHAAQAFFTLYDSLPAMLAEGAPFHPETLAGYALTRAGCIINDTLDAEFAFRRRDGNFEHAVMLPSEIARYTAALSARKTL